MTAAWIGHASTEPSGNWAALKTSASAAAKDTARWDSNANAEGAAIKRGQPSQEGQGEAGNGTKTPCLPFSLESSLEETLGG